MGEYVNSRQAQFNKSFVSCGILEVHHLPKATSQATIFSILTSLYHKSQPRPAAWVMFSDTVPEDGTKSRGQQLAEAIEKLWPGVLRHGPVRVNPKTGNSIIWWMWDLNPEVLRRWYQDQLANREVEE